MAEVKQRTIKMVIKMNMPVQKVFYIDHLTGTYCRDTRDVSDKWGKWDT